MNLTPNYAEIAYYIINLAFFLYWLYHKTKIETYRSIVFVLFGVFFLFSFKEDAANYILSHILYEFIPIFLAFTLISFTEVLHLHAKEEKDELNFWTSYIYNLAKTKKTIVAFNTDDYDNLLQPLGLRYFAEQIKEISTRPYNDRRIRKDRTVSETISSTHFEDIGH